MNSESSKILLGRNNFISDTFFEGYKLFGNYTSSCRADLRTIHMLLHQHSNVQIDIAFGFVKSFDISPTLKYFFTISLCMF